MTPVAASVGLADIGNYCPGVVMLGSKGSNESVLGVDCYSLGVCILSETHDV
jgi:hypothetical protein